MTFTKRQVLLGCALLVLLFAFLIYGLIFTYRNLITARQQAETGRLLAVKLGNDLKTYTNKNGDRVGQTSTVTIKKDDADEVADLKNFDVKKKKNVDTYIGFSGSAKGSIKGVTRADTTPVVHGVPSLVVDSLVSKYDNEGSDVIGLHTYDFTDSFINATVTIIDGTSVIDYQYTPKYELLGSWKGGNLFKKSTLKMDIRPMNKNEVITQAVSVKFTNDKKWYQTKGFIFGAGFSLGIIGTLYLLAK